ncbi:MAG: hypothetical protein GY810_21095, partial [Aureispira sp.]|nr:hypothetical protein [Aureispira sp.]
MKKNENEKYLKAQKILKNLGLEIDLNLLDKKSKEALFKLCQEHEQLKAASKTVSGQEQNAS